MQIRRADIPDEAVLAYIRQRAILELAPPVLTVEQAVTWAADVAPGRILRALCAHTVWVAVDMMDIGWVDVHDDHIAGLYVLPSYAYHGVGTALLGVAETAIRRAGYAQARLEASQNARTFYIKRHYVPVGPQAPDGSFPLAKDLRAGGYERAAHGEEMVPP